MEITLTKTINIEASPDKVWSYVNDLSKWPQWAIHNVMDSKKAENGYWLMTGPGGVSKIKMKSEKSLGILDHDFIDPGEGKWSVSCRVVAGYQGSHFMITFTKPDKMPIADFEKGMSMLDDELARLKEILEE